MATALMTLREARLGFGEKELFRGVSLAVQPGDRIALVGRNGSGKSTLLKVMAGRIEADGGDRFIKPGARAAYLAQDLPRVPGLTVAGYIAEGLEEGDVAADDYRVRRLLDAVSLDGGTELLTLSGGESRRAAIARALIGEPDLLFLDEPTNHLDLPTIEWLEGELARSRAATVIVSHDRAFLARLTRRTYWLEDGTLRVNEAGFDTFEAWSEKLREEEAQSLARLAKEIEVEERWLARGVTARRRRNQGRLRRLHDLRRERQERTRSDKAAALDLETGKASGALVIEATDLVKRFKRDGETTTIVDGFSTRIMRGDRVGVIGPNGAGKTTLLRLLLGEIAPDSGTVRHGTRLEIVHIDQRRDQLDPEATLWESLAPGGGDSVMVHGRPIHVVAYLKQFLFQEAQARSPVRSLSGGEKNRLLLAILLARPCNLLVLDEPTNDLDLETLELLEEQLADFDGTVLIVSHDRAFLDRTVSSLIAVEGEGEIAEYVGGYEDYQRERSRTARREPAGRKAAAAGSPPAEKGQKAPARRSGLSYKDKREYEGLPARIAALEAEIARQEKALADPTLYGRDPDRFHKLAGALDAARAELAAAEERWLELEILKDELQGS